MASSGSFDGHAATFTVSDSSLMIEIHGSPTDTIKLDAIIGLTESGDPENKRLHLFRSKVEGEWKARNVVYEVHNVTGLPADSIDLSQISEVPAALLTAPGTPANNWICISTLSGTGEAEHFWDAALSPLFAELKIDGFQVLKTTSPDSITEFCKETVIPRANECINQTIILLAGDGGPVDMINALAQGLSDSATVPTVALIPMGTGNALAHSSGIGKDSTFGARSILRGHPRSIPVFRVTLSPLSKYVTKEGQLREEIPLWQGSQNPVLFGGVVCSWGFHASLVADSDTVDYRKFGAERFGMAAKELLVPKDGSAPHVYRGRVAVFDKSHQHKANTRSIGTSEHSYVLLTLASNLEQTFTISPESKPLDGQLRLVHFGPIPADDMMRLMGLAYQGGQHVQDPMVDYESVGEMRIDFEEDDERWRRICIDGKIVAVEKDGWVEVEREEREVLNMLVPS